METQYARCAGFWPRLGALLIDLLLFVPLILGSFWAMGQSSIVYALYTFLNMALIAVYKIYFHGRWGATLGKKALGIKVIDIGGGAIGYVQALKREAVNIGFSVLSAIAVVISLMTLENSEQPPTGWVDRMAAVGSSFFSAMVNLSMQIWMLFCFFMIIFQKQRRTGHDFIAQTVVIYVPKKQS
jgi:uncharacterized RDD family membrane protein YckC